MGGSGKTTLVPKLCLDVANDPKPDRIPLIVYARDVQPADLGVPAETLILLSLPRRFDLPLPAGIFPEVLRRLATFLVIDGLDEAGTAYSRC